MKKFWKWFIGILAGLLVLGLLIGGAFMLHSFGGFRDGFPGHMRGFGMMPFGGLFGGLLQLGFLALVVLGIVWLVRSLKTLPTPAPQPVCTECGKPVQEGWKACPYCGTKR